MAGVEPDAPDNVASLRGGGPDEGQVEPQLSLHLQRALTGPPQQLYWQELEDLGKVMGAEVSRTRWREVRLAATREFESGSRGADVVRGQNGLAWDDARFGALRDSLVSQWGDGAAELMLIDTLSQAFTEWEKWMGLAALRSRTECATSAREIATLGKWAMPTLERSAAINEAVAMADRWNRIFLRTLRALRDLVRYVPSIRIENAEQVSIGGQQLQVRRAADPGTGRESGGHSQEV